MKKTMMMTLMMFAALPAFANETVDVDYSDASVPFYGVEDVGTEEIEALESELSSFDHDRRGDHRRDDRGRAHGCDPRTQPYPHYGMKGGQCLASCGHLGGNASFSDSCARHGMRDMGRAYDVPYCCYNDGRGRGRDDRRDDDRRDDRRRRGGRGGHR